MRTSRFLIPMSAALALAACASSPPPPASSPPYQPPPPPYQPSPPPAMSLQDRVHDALQRQMGAAASGISVRVEGSKAFLSGHVGSQADSNRAHDIAHDVSGVSSVDHSGLRVH